MKFSVSRLLETAKILNTEVGKQIPDFFSYMSDFVENTARCLRSGLTFADNFACDVKTVSLTSGSTQVVSATKPVVGIVPIRVISQVHGLESFAWYYDSANRLVVKAVLTGTPTAPVDVTLVLLF